MSGNADVVRAIYAVEPRHGLRLDLLDPGVEWRAPVGDEPVYRGRAGVERFWRSLLEHFDSYHAEVEDLVERGDRVVAMVHVRATGAHSRIPVEHRVAHAWTLRNGLVTRLEVHATLEDALRGVSPEGPT